MGRFVGIEDREGGEGPRWWLMLAVLAAAILIAALIAYRMIYPFFHRPKGAGATEKAALYMEDASSGV